MSKDWSVKAMNINFFETFSFIKKVFNFCGTLAVFTVLAVSAFAQTIDKASIRGKVLDQNRAAIVGARVSVVNEDRGLRRDATTDENGYYAITDLPLTGTYKVTVSGAGFADAEKTGIQLRANEAATVDAVLFPQKVQNVVTVTGTAETLQTDSARLETRFDLEKIENTPILSRKTTNLVQLNSAVRPARGTGDLFLNNFLFVVNGSGRRQTSFVLDGSTGDDAWGRQTLFTNLPFQTLQEFTVLTNTISAEFGRTTGSVVNIVSKSGTNQFHADGTFLFRPAGLQASEPFATSRTTNNFYQLSGVVSGPIIEDRTHFLIGAEYNRQRRDTVINSALAPGLFEGTYKQTLFFARVDHQINEKNTLTGRINLDRFTDTNPADAVGGINLPSAARTFRRGAYAAQLSETAVLSGSAVNVARFQFQLGSPITEFEPAQLGTQFVRPGLSVEGESRTAFLQNHQYQFADTLSLLLGRHALKLGGDIEFSSSGGNGQEFGTGFYLGQFTFRANAAGVTDPNVPTSALPLSAVQRYTQSFGNANYNVRETLWSLFVQDDWRVNRNLTLNLGLRYDRQTFTDDTNNFAPRLGFAYTPFNNGRTVVRGSYGVFYSELRANTGAQFALSGPNGVFTFSAAPGQFGFPTSFSALPQFPAGAVLPARDIVIRPGRADYYNQFFDVSKLKGYPDKLLNPYTQQATIGVQHEFPYKIFLSVDYVRAHTADIDRTLDLNSPSVFIPTAANPTRSAAQADATRPISPVPNGFKRIQAVVNEGVSDYNGLQINLEKRFTRRLSFLASYTLSKTTNTVEPDVPRAEPADYNLLGENERALSLLDQRHRFVFSGYYKLPYQFTIGGVTTLASGRPYNITSGIDINGDGATNDRPLDPASGKFLERNAGRGSAVYQTDLFAQKSFVFGERTRLEFRAEAFNIFNRTNVVGRNGTYGSVFLGNPSPRLGNALGGINNVDPGRQIQFQARFRY